MERTSIIERIRKLQKMTLAAGCTENEAANAAALVAKLIAENNIGMDELRLRRDATGCIKDCHVELRGSEHDWVAIGKTLARTFGTRCWYSTDYEDVLELGFCTPTLRLWFFGLPADVEACVTIATICSYAVSTASGAFTVTQRGRGKGKAQACREFRFGMIARLAERITELRPTIEASTGTALVVVKTQLVNEEFLKLGMRLRTVARPTINTSSAAYASGRTAGSRVDLGRGKVPTSRQALPTH